MLHGGNGETASPIPVSGGGFFESGPNWGDVVVGGASVVLGRRGLLVELLVSSGEMFRRRLIEILVGGNNITAVESDCGVVIDDELDVSEDSGDNLKELFLSSLVFFVVPISPKFEELVKDSSVDGSVGLEDLGVGNVYNLAIGVIDDESTVLVVKGINLADIIDLSVSTLGESAQLDARFGFTSFEINDFSVSKHVVRTIMIIKIIIFSAREFLVQIFAYTVRI